MILSKEVEIILNPANMKHFHSLGYDNLKRGNKLIVPIEHLNMGSHFIIRVECDICGKEKKLSYNKYIENIKKYNIYSCSNKCAMIKNKKTCLEKYGFVHSLQNTNVKNNRIKTNIEKYEVEYCFQDDKIKEKSKKTKLKKYGDENYNNKNKCYKTCLEKYGVENYFSSNEYKIKMGIILDKDIKDKWTLYKRKSWRLFKKMKIKVFENWNGYDYYDNEYIKDNMYLHYNDKRYPSVDHKISVYYGFINDIPVEEINKLENLVVTKIINNCIKGKMCKLYIQ